MSMSRNNGVALGLAAAGGVGAYIYGRSTRQEAPRRPIPDPLANKGEQDKQSGDIESTDSQSAQPETVSKGDGNVKPEEQPTNNQGNNSSSDDAPKAHETRGVSKMGSDVPSKKQPAE